MNKIVMGILIFAVMVLAAVLVLVFAPPQAAHSPARPEAGPGDQPLLLFCGAGIRPAAEALIAGFEERTGTRIAPTYAGSGHLMGQIATSGKGDLFIPGDDSYIAQAIEREMVRPETVRVLAFFTPVLLVQSGNPLGLRKLADLARPKLRLGFADERSAAIGRQTPKLMEKNGVPWAAIESNTLYRSSTVEELGVAIRLRTIDATIVWDVTARHFADAAEAIPIPPEQNIVSPIAAAVLRASKQVDAARAFIDYATSAEGRRLLREGGWSIPAQEEENAQ